MENGTGGVYPNDVATLALLGGGAGYGYGWGGHGYGYGAGVGYPGNSVLAANAHADGTALGVSVKNLGDTATEFRITDLMRDLKDEQFRGTLAISDRLIANQIDNLRNQADMRQQLSDCCCDIKSEICDLKAQNIQDKADVLAAIAAVETRAITRDLDKAQSRVTQLETINAITQQCGCCGGSSLV